MSHALLTTLILSAVSCALQGAGYLVRALTRVSGLLCLLWLAAALPIMYFLNLSAQHVLLFYLLSALAGLILNLGGRPQ